MDAEFLHRDSRLCVFQLLTKGRLFPYELSTDSPIGGLGPNTKHR
jgi:hypothetical protein